MHDKMFFDVFFLLFLISNLFRVSTFKSIIPYGAIISSAPFANITFSKLFVRPAFMTR